MAETPRTTVAIERLHPRVALALVVAGAGGAGLSLQSFVNGRLNDNVGSAELAGSVNSVAATLALGVVIVLSGAGASALRRLRSTGARPKWWYIVIPGCGGFAGIITSKAAPEIGVALLTVALVAGQTTGSIVFDAIGLSPAGRRPPTAGRVLGVVLALVAVTLGALGAESHGHLDAGLLILSVAAGVTIPATQAAVGHLADMTGDAMSAAGVVVFLSAVVAVGYWLLFAGGSAPGGWSAPPEQWALGGVLGATVVTLMAWAVHGLGVLRLTLALVPGQSVGALVIDGIAPAGEAVTTRTVLSVLLTFLAVAISGLARRATASPIAEVAIDAA